MAGRVLQQLENLSGHRRRHRTLSITHKFGRRVCEPQRRSLFVIVSVVFEAKSLS